MSVSAIEAAKALIRRRKFPAAITTLEAKADVYENNFDYYLTLGIANLYVGDPGSAGRYFSLARHIRVTDTQLLLGQAAIFLQRGETDRALPYYLDVLDYEPGNQVAKKAMEFIRVQGNYETICKWVDTGKIKEFYPPIGVNPDMIVRSVLGGIALGVVICLFLYKVPHPARFNPAGPRADVTALVLSASENRSAVIESSESGGGTYTNTYTAKEVSALYEDALRSFEQGRDNEVQVTLNRLLDSNASFSVKKKVQLLMDYLFKPEPTFSTVKDLYPYAQVAAQPALYQDCRVVWSGRIANAVTSEKGEYTCDLLEGYETAARVDGIVPLKFAVTLSEPLDPEKPLRVLGRVCLDNGTLYLLVSSVFQPVTGTELPPLSK